MTKVFSIAFFVALIFAGCEQPIQKETYAYSFNLLKNHTETIELNTEDKKARIVVVPEFQGRVATSTNSGLSGRSFGWLNTEPLESSTELNGSEIHGEERVWIGPQGGQYSFYYGQTQPINEDNWSVPKTFDGEPFDVVSTSEKQIEMTKSINLTNYHGTKLNMKLERKIRIFEIAEIENRINTKIPEGISVVGYASIHKLTNTDSTQWKKDSGLATIWSLSTFKGTDKTVTFIPLKSANSSNKILQYLNVFEDDRFKIENDVAWYKTDGKYRSKIGIPPEISKGYFGSYQPETKTLRIIRFHQTNHDSLYFNSEVTVQEHPYKGEAIAVYNNGPMTLQEGDENSFFEMESIAAMKELKPNESIEHFHEVYQFTGDFENLKKISMFFLGVDLSKNPFYR